VILFSWGKRTREMNGHEDGDESAEMVSTLGLYGQDLPFCGPKPTSPPD